ncbi:hypothetical protein [Vogesella indigofera]|uniref:Uncharacterized protein n=1 Tax=Vogesella indigofera TaxID=45465 RepID=A0ABT5I3H9_VOGIN|nr:hypothetical protein [Vogesella indigofera]MDC7690736.1 hypothetical protein [Vogesella indigofera]
MLLIASGSRQVAGPLRLAGVDLTAYLSGIGGAGHPAGCRALAFTRVAANVAAYCIHTRLAHISSRAMRCWKKRFMTLLLACRLMTGLWMSLVYLLN